MAFDINLYTFSKKLNSTAIPTTPARTFNCKLKEPCGILAPTISLNLGLANSPHDYNYAYIPEFSRYYFVKEWVYESALWYAQLDVDVLATWKTEIGQSECYILRSATAFNGEIVDTTYAGTSDTSLQESQSATSPWITDNMANGVYVVGIAGQSTTYYIFTQEGLDLFFTFLFSGLYASALLGMEWVSLFPEAKQQSNPLQYITSIMWYPFITVGTSVETIRVGYVDVPCAAWKVDGVGIVAGTSGWTLRKHPQASRGDYLNNAPFSNYMLFYPPFGTIPLDPDSMANSEVLVAEWLVDLRTGHATMEITCGADIESASHIMSWIQSQVGVHYQVSQVVNKGYGFGNAFMPALSTAANILAENYAGAAATVAGEIGNAAAAKIPSATTIGSNGGLDTLRGIPALQYEFKLVVEDDNTHRGKPLCENRVINTLGGYTKVANAYIDIAATQIEKNSIISYMEGGFFYE